MLAKLCSPTEMHSNHEIFYKGSYIPPIPHPNTAALPDTLSTCQFSEWPGNINLYFDLNMQSIE